MTDAPDYDLKPQAARPPSPLESNPVPPPTSAKPPPVASDTVADAKASAAEAARDIHQNKGMALLAYLGVLVIVPLVFGQHSKFVRHHTNQGLILMVLEVVVWVGCKTLMLLGYPLFHLHALVYLTSFVGGLIWLVFAMFSLMGLLHVAGGSFADLPVVGSYEVLNVEGSED